MSDTWYYADQGKRSGPVSLQDLRNALARMPNAPEVLVWRDGFPDWKKAGDIPELRPAGMAPPLPGAGAPGLPAAAGPQPSLVHTWFGFSGRSNRAKYWLVV